MSEYKLIDTEIALVAEFRKLVFEGYLASVLGVELVLEDTNGAEHLGIGLSGNRQRFCIEYKLNPGSREIERLAAAGSVKTPILLVTVSASSSLLKACQKQQVSCLDLHGHAWIKTSSFLISTPLLKQIQYKYETGDHKPNLFSKKSSRLARALLAAPEKTWKQSELVKETGLAAGLVSRLLNYLVRTGWVEGERAAWRLLKPDDLLDNWLEQDVWSTRTTVRHFSCLERDFDRIAGDLAKRIDELAFTQWYAAFLRHPFTTPPLLSCYCRRFPSPNELTALGFTEVPTGGRVLLVVPSDEGVFRSGQKVRNLPLVSDAQIYLDLAKQGLRGTEQAKALREWSGFCR